MYLPRARDRARATFIIRGLMFPAMAKESKGEGFHSAAGLIRYFDSEDEKALKIPPWFVVAMAVGISVAIIIAGWQFPV